MQTLQMDEFLRSLKQNIDTPMLSFLERAHRLNPVSNQPWIVSGSGKKKFFSPRIPG